jgi:hypothetical protein
VLRRRKEIAMVSEVAICNNALLKIHAQTITALTDNSQEAVACNILYSQMRDDVLTAHPWNFAIAEATPSLSVDAPIITQFSYKYLIPADSLRIIKVTDSSGNLHAFKVKGGFIHTNGSSIKCEYIKKQTDTAMFSSQFVDVLATRLASELAYALAGSSERSQFLAQLYSEKIKEAKRRDGQEGTPDRITASTWIKSRDSAYTKDPTIVQ